MASSINGLSNYYNLTAQLANVENNASLDPDNPQSIILDIEKNFSSLLNTLLDSDDDDDNKSDPLDSLMNSGSTFGSNSSSSIDSLQQSLLASQRLQVMGQNSSLLGEQVIYFDRTANQETTGKVDKILVDDNAIPKVVLTNGQEIAIGDVLGIKDN